MDIYKTLENFRDEELKAIKKDRKKGIPVRINPKSLIAKEILRQTVLLKQIIQNQQKQITLLEKMDRHD